MPTFPRWVAQEARRYASILMRGVILPLFALAMVVPGGIAYGLLARNFHEQWVFPAVLGATCLIWNCQILPSTYRYFYTLSRSLLGVVLARMWGLALSVLGAFLFSTFAVEFQGLPNWFVPAVLGISFLSWTVLTIPAVYNTPYWAPPPRRL